MNQQELQTKRILSQCESNIDVVKHQLEYMRSSSKEMIGYWNRKELIKLYESAIETHNNNRNIKIK